MKRRTFVQTSVATLCTAAAAQTLAAEPAAKGRELYELRRYDVKAGKQALMDDYLSKALLPALKRYGIGPVGVFIEKPAKDKGDTAKVFVLIVHRSPEQFATLSTRLAA